jgi:hypothetical protein
MTVIINGLILSLINILSILIGFLVYYLTKSQTQIAIQIIVACFSSVILFLFWQFISHDYFPKTALNTKEKYWKTFLLSLIFAPIIFIPLHYITQGYLTSWQNITSIWMFQIPTNFLVLNIYKNFSKFITLRKKLKEISRNQDL